MSHLPSSPRLLGCAAIAALALTFGCSSTPPPNDQHSQNASFGPTDLSPGTNVMIQKQGQWLPGTIVQPLGAGRFLVHYTGFEDKWNEPVGAEQIRALPPGMMPPAASPGVPRDYKAGEKVLVTAQSRTLLAEIVQQVGQDSWRVHYDGYGPEIAENVGPDRIRRPFVGMSPHNTGDAVLVDVSGQPLPGKVLALVAADKWLVRFDNFGAQYDQEVGPDRIKTAPPPAPPAVAPPPAEPPKADKDKGKGKGKGKEKDKDAGTVAMPSGPIQANEAVLVSVRGGSFLPATVLGAGAAAGHWKVRFDGAGGGEEEVAEARIVRQPTSLKGIKFAPQQAVLVEWHGLYVGGKVLKEAARGEFKIRFDGQGPEADEVVNIKRLRPR